MDQKEKVYMFKVTLKRHKKLYRELAVKGSSSLHKFAEIITGAFNFDLDHAFGFFSNLNNAYDQYCEAYTVFHDLENVIHEPHEKSVENNYIYNVFEPGKKMLFMFDYGDEWEFIVKCCRVIEAEAGKTYPQVTKQLGEAPKQYVYDDDEDEDFEPVPISQMEFN